MPETELELALRNFDQIATLVRDRAARQVWSFQFHDHAYFLYFHPRVSALRRFFQSTSALTEFFNLQAMQKADVPSPHAVAHLSGFRIGEVLGDAVIVEAIDGAIPLDEYLRDHMPGGEEIPHRRALVDQIAKIINGIGRLKLGNRDLGLRSFLVRDGKLFFHDSSRLQSGGMQLNDLLTLGHESARYATRGELLRGWQAIEPDDPPPAKNRVSPSIWTRLVKNSRGENDGFGMLTMGAWSGNFVKTPRFAQPWSVASRLTISSRDWDAAWPILLAQLESGQLTEIKRDASGEVLEGEVILAGRPIRVIVKRPRQKIWWRNMLDFFRPSRAARMWAKTWMVIARDLPCEWPMLLMERRVNGRPVDSVVIFERVPGARLDQVDLDAMNASKREMLFFRAGRMLRQLEGSGLIHYDTKSTNWIVFDDAAKGPTPIMLDCYGIRPLNFFLEGWSMRRLLRAMRNHKQYAPLDSLSLCRGFVPRAAAFEQEQTERTG